MQETLNNGEKVASSCTGVILAGGLNTRFMGKNKSLIDFNGKHLIDYIFETFCLKFEKIILISNNPIQHLDLDLMIAADIYETRSALNGIFTGLFHIKTPFAFFTACDTPFVKPELIQLIIDEIKPKIDIVVPEISLGLEPLCAIYSKNCLKVTEELIAKKEFKIRHLFDKMRVKKINETSIRKIDLNLDSFYNINSSNDLNKLKKGNTL